MTTEGEATAASTYYFVGSGIASLAGAAFLIRDGNVSGRNIVIFEQASEFGGALDAHGSAESGYYMSGSRMFEHEYRCTNGLMSSIPSRSDARLSVTQETDRARAEGPWYAKARLVDRERRVVDAHALGLNERDRIDLIALLASHESTLDSTRVTDHFEKHFFTSNFWFEWCTLFAFQPWHSAIEFRRYLLRFLHHFSTIDTQQGVYRTRYNQYDSIAAPLVAWLETRGVRIRLGTAVVDLGFVTDGTAGTAITVDSIECVAAGVAESVSLSRGDCVFVTTGSMTADETFASGASVPAIERGKRSGAWQLWETLARGRPQFGNPSVFDDHVEESLWESFTVTVDDAEFFERMKAFSGSEAGTGGLITFKDSAWLLTISIFKQPLFAGQPDGTYVWWGYGLFNDRIGDYVRKPMSACTGAEILEEVLGHLGFGDRDALLASSTVITCMMPYITSEFLVRKAGDRPHVVPHRSTNLAFLGQYAEIPDDVVFTVEYSIRSAQMAVYTLLNIDRTPPPMYKGAHDPRVLVQALATLHR